MAQSCTWIFVLQCYQVCSNKIEVAAKFQEMEKSLKCNLLFFQGSQALRGKSQTDFVNYLY